jgi:hypothetical protein
MALVFQYGSNMNSARLNGPKRLQGCASLVGAVQTVENYEYVFDIWSGGENNCAAADILSGHGRPIWGVLYEIPMRDIERDPEGKRRTLDAIEGEGKNYSRGTINVQFQNGEIVSAPVITYFGRDRKTNIQTTARYVENIFLGLAEHPNIPAEYVQYVRTRVLANNPNLRLS